MAAFLRTAGATKSESRADIQALRAVAVLLVVGFHLFPSGLAGGYIGVDAFLATSGFLITRHLTRELDQHGRIALREFWARRARRLLPASFLVLIVTAIGTFCFAPPATWSGTTRDLIAATLYSVNFVFAHDATDYFAQDATPSPVQHYWSLCVEEQFYLFWPLVLAGIALVTRRKPATTGRLLQVASVLLFLGSFALSVTVTRASPAEAYFLPWTRAWEFIAGGLLAIFQVELPTKIRPEPVRWLGFALLLAISWVWRDATGFPGAIAALPIAATLLVLVPSRRQDRPFDLPVLRALEPLGNISYGVYLWHWPLLILAKKHLGRELATSELLGLFVATVVLAIASKRSIEDPIRFAQSLVRAPARRTFWVTALGTCVVLCFPAALKARLYGIEAAQRAEMAAVEQFKRHPCFGAGSPASGPACHGLEGESFLIPSPLDPDDRSGQWKCMTGRTTEAFTVCEFGADGAQATYALVGDSHAGHLLPGIAEAARRSNARFIAMLKGGCAFSRVRRGGGDLEDESCEHWKDQVRETLAQRSEIHTLISVGRVVGGKTRAKAAGFLEEWLALPAHVRQIVVVRDVPKSQSSPMECLSRLPNQAAQLEPGACATPRSRALKPDPALLAAKRLRKRARAIDLSPVFCNEEACFPVLGHSLVYFDDHHLTEAFSATLWPHLMDIFKPKRKAKSKRRRSSPG